MLHASFRLLLKQKNIIFGVIVKTFSELYIFQRSLNSGPLINFTNRQCIYFIFLFFYVGILARMLFFLIHFIHYIFTSSIDKIVYWINSPHHLSSIPPWDPPKSIGLLLNYDVDKPTIWLGTAVVEFGAKRRARLLLIHRVLKRCCILFLGHWKRMSLPRIRTADLPHLGGRSRPLVHRDALFSQYLSIGNWGLKIKSGHLNWIWQSY